MKRILITTSTFDRCHQELELISSDFNVGISFNPYKRRISSSELIDLLDDDVIALVAGVEDINKEVLAKASSLKVISRCGVGADNVDVILAKQRGVSVFITPDAPTQAVAELTVGLMLSALRQITLHDRLLKTMRWERKSSGLLSSKTVGLVGYGRIGQCVAKLLSSFDAKIIYFDPIRNDCNLASSVDSLDEVLARSDIISLHMPANKHTSGMVKSSFLEKMKSNAILVNTSRGSLINENDLYNHLVNYPEVIAALDVFNVEPYTGELRELPNTILTPHVGSYTKESRLAMEKEALINLIKGLERLELVNV